jgi:deoxyribonuclease V
MHRWDVSPAEAVAIQQRLRGLVQRTDGVRLEAITSVAGVDASYGAVARAAVVAFSFPELRVVEQAVVSGQSTFPYVPGILSFREAPLVLAALGRLRSLPDVLICDAQGYAHPRRFGLACHLGVHLDRPSIGCAKSRLVGTYDEPGPNQGDRSPLMDAGEVIGMVVRTRARTNPVFVSVGHKIDLETAVEVVLHCVRGYRLPEPTRVADRLTRQPDAAQ